MSYADYYAKFNTTEERDGGVMHIVQARPNRAGHIPSEAESTARITFGEKYGRQKHLELLERTMKGQMELDFGS